MTRSFVAEDEYAIGVDAGGSATRIALARLSDDEAAFIEEGPANAITCGPREAAAVIADAIARVMPPTGIPVAFYVGAAGAGSEAVSRVLVDCLHERFPMAAALRVGDDLEIALRSVIFEGPGVALVGGTGSAAYGENGDLVVRVGGDGHLLGDEGSGFAIGFAALKLAAHAYDGRARYDETVRLAERVLEFHDRDSLLARIYGESGLEVAKIASLAPIVIAFAGKGNAASTAIVRNAASDLVSLAVAAIEQCFPAEGAMQVALCGGLFREATLRTLVTERLNERLPNARVQCETSDPNAHARTALRLAIVLRGVTA